MQNVNLKNSTLYLAVAAMFVAVITGGKMALAVLPNVEVVSVLFAVCAYVWGLGMALPVAAVFVLIQTAYYSFNVWVIEYIIYWPLLCLCFWALSKVRFKKRLSEAAAATALAVLLTLFFGVFTSVCDTLIGYGSNGFNVVSDNFWQRFCVMYARGTVFFAIHVGSNAAMFSVAFYPLVVLNKKAKLRMFAC